MFFPLAILCFAGVPMALSEKVHETMSIDQIQEIFHKPHHNLVPDYKVVQFEVSSRKKRSALEPERLAIADFGSYIKAWLTPAKGVLASKNTPVIRAHTKGSDPTIYYQELPDVMERVGELWEDPDKAASFVVKRDINGQYSLDGFIGDDNLVVRSLPQSISDDLIRKRSLNDSQASSNARSAYHVVFRGDQLDALNKAMFRDAQGRSERSSNVGNRAPIRWKPLPREKYVYPEVMVVVDYDLYKSYPAERDRPAKIVRYLLAFWNGVDLLYRKLAHPSIRFNIARIILATDYNATPYLTNNFVGNRVKGHEAWLGAQTYYYQKLNKFNSSTYDAVVTMVGRKMLSPKGGEWLGVASLGGVCLVDDAHERVMSVALTQDDGHFKEIFTAAHEFGHLLGIGHDGEGNNCSKTSGHLLNPSDVVTEDSHDFSLCSLEMLEKFLMSDSAQCMHEPPKQDASSEPMPRILPGELLNRTELCNHRGFEESCFTGSPDESPCSALYCKNRTDSSCQTLLKYLLPEGTECGDGKICLNGDCLFDQYQPIIG